MAQNTLPETNLPPASPFQPKAAPEYATATSAPDETPRWFAALAEAHFAIPLLLAFGTLIFLVNIGGYPLYTKGEPREAVTILDIYNGGGVILPMRAGVEVPSKPPLMHWLGALASVAMGGVSEASVRLPSAILAIAGMLICYLYVRQLFDPLAALVSALILGTTFQYVQAGTGARVDTTLTFFMEAAFFEFIAIGAGLTARRMLLYVAIALAVLAKGPVGLVLPGAVGLAWMIVQRRWDLVKELRMVRGATVVLVLAGSWYVAASIVGGMSFVDKQLLAENFVRYFGARHFHEGHVHPFYYLELALMGGFLPWTVALAIVFTRAIRTPGRAEPRFNYLVVWFGGVLFFYSFAESKRGVYLLALYPALAAIAGLYIADAIRNPPASEWIVRILTRIGAMFFASIAIIAALGLILLWLWPGRMVAIFGVFGIRYAPFTDALAASARAHLGASLLIPAATFALGAALFRIKKAGAEHLTLGVAAGMVLLVLAANVVVVPAIANTLALKNFSADMARIVDHHSVAYLEALDYDVAFYTGLTIPIISRDQEMPEYVVTWESLYDQIPPAKRAQYRLVETSNPTGLDGKGKMLLLKRGRPATTPTAPPSAPTMPKRPNRRNRTISASDGCANGCSKRGGHPCTKVAPFVTRSFFRRKLKTESVLRTCQQPFRDENLQGNIGQVIAKPRRRPTPS